MLRDEQVLTDEVIETVGIQRIAELASGFPGREVPPRHGALGKFIRLHDHLMGELLPKMTGGDIALMRRIALMSGLFLGYAIAWEYAGIRFGGEGEGPR
jgi:hypothetical protein